jgi:methionyl aminopeptidase
MAIRLKSESQIAALREANRLVAESFVLLEQAIRPGARLSDLDDMVTEFIVGRGAEPLYKGYRGNPPSHPPFPGTICASVNEEICHGLPDRRRLREGDIIGIDIGVRLNGWCGDACVTFPVGVLHRACSSCST